MMVLQYLSAKLSVLPSIVRPLYDALTTRSLPWSLRWRTLTLFPINILTALLTSPTWLFNNRYSVIYVPTRSGPKRCLVYLPPEEKDESKSNIGQEKQRPLHIDAHGGAFLGGLAEYNARWCSFLSDRTGAVVISVQYRSAPRYTYPAAHEDVDDIVTYLLTHASDFNINVDTELLTLGGSSAGANLLLSTSQSLVKRNGIKPLAFISFCPVLDLRVPPSQKPKPPSFPKQDPSRFLMPLFDAYAAPVRPECDGDARLHPILARKEALPRDVLVVVAGIDILAHEQLSFVERVQGELEGEGNPEGRRVEARVFERAFHGWLECKCLP
ncbi:Alpha/Beta hydrolase protein [Lophiotrema nucula]|uniref:Alpha/Beta hydrolase protein n=1 Tax=Lophiotrema nucula TaxID=690887 RepID=A0A6A5YQ87_9PLEO|nr:Alpha/Beta hydrolase protein [Lophiotrema nucula]